MGAGVDINAKHDHGCTALCNAVRSGHVEVVAYLLEHAADSSPTMKDGKTVLMMAAESETAELLDLLLAHTPRVNQRDVNGYTALWHAVNRGRDKNVLLLLQKGAQPDPVDADGGSALVLAVARGNTQIAGPLLSSMGQILQHVPVMEIRRLSLRQIQGRPGWSAIYSSQALM